MAIVSPLGEESIFYIPETVDSSPVTTAYKHYIEERTSGLDILEAYKNATVEANEIIIFFETNMVKGPSGKLEKQTNNLFGTVCLVKIGSDYLKNIINKANAGYEVSILNQGIVKKTVRSLDEYCQALHEIYPAKILDSKSLYNAIQMEVRAPNSVEHILSDIYKSNADFSDWIGMGITKLEDWKLTEENYDFEKHYLVPSLNKKRGIEPQQITYRPIIPVPVLISGKDQLISNVSTYSKIKNLAETFTETILGAVDELVKTTPDKIDDKVWAFIKELFIKLNDTIKGFLGPIYEQLKELLGGIFSFITDLIKLAVDLAAEVMALLNAIVCGMVNGFISIIQTILSIVELVSKVTPFNLAAQALPENLLKYQETMELVEDAIDLLTENAAAIFKGLIDTLTDKETWKQLSSFIHALWRKFTDTNTYFWAYILGAVVFEVVVEILLAILTAGGSAAASISGRISRATAKAQALFRKGAQATKTAGKAIGKVAVDISQWLRKEIAELIEALKNRKFVEWVREKMRAFFPSKEMDDLLNSDYLADWDKDLPVSGRGFKGGRTLRRKEIKEWMNKVTKMSNGRSSIIIIPKNHKSLMGNRAAFNPFNGNIYVQKGMTEYEIFHESRHLEEFLKVGKDAYIQGMQIVGGSPADNLIRTYKREKYVLDEIMKNSKMFNAEELKHAQWIIDKIIKDGIDAGIDLLTH